MVYIYVLMDPLVDDHPNIVQPTQQFIILAYREIIVPNPWFSEPPLFLGGCELLIELLWWFYDSFMEVTLGLVTPICTSVPSVVIFILNILEVVKISM